MMARCATELRPPPAPHRATSPLTAAGSVAPRQVATFTISLFGKKQQDYESDMQYGRVHRAASLRVGGVVGARVVAAPGLAFGAGAAGRAGRAPRAAAARRAWPRRRLTVANIYHVIHLLLILSFDIKCSNIDHSFLKRSLPPLCER